MKNKFSIVSNFILAALCCFLFTTAYGQEAEPKNVKDIAAAQVKAKLNPAAGKSSALDRALKAKGHALQKDKVIGKEWEYEQNGKKVKESLYLQDYKKAGKSGVLGKVVIESGNERNEYDFYIESSDKNPDEREEFYVDKDNKVQKTHSWWTCVRAGLISCSTGCASGLTSCWNGSWVNYLTCLAGKCGFCYLKRTACCSCNCGTFCKWATGCCRQ
jgi:hypothetical protein